MSDRKSINKYYPPDFDPSKILRRKKPKSDKFTASSLQTVRLMSPFSMQCTTCGEFIYKGKKFNARKQPTGDSYLGIKIIRFYIRCPRCSGEIRFRTEPKLGDYVTEVGAVRNHEPWRIPIEEQEETLDQRLDRLEKENQEREELEAKGGVSGGGLGQVSSSGAIGADPLEEIEQKAMSTKREMDVQDELDNIRARNARIDTASVNEGLIVRAQEELDAEDEAKRQQLEKDDMELARKAFRNTDGDVIKRVVSTSMPGSISIPLSTNLSLPTNLTPGIVPKKAAKSLGIVKKANSLGIVRKTKRSLV